MIYLFDKHKKLKGTVRARHTIALLYERERNGIYSVSAEIPVSLTDKRTVYNYHKKVKGSDFIGHYDREGRFQLHKIAAVDIENNSIFIKGIHLFFDEAKAGAIIRERRFRGREIIDGAREAFDPIGWSVVDFDTSDQKNYSFYNVSPLEARAILVETFGFEFDYWLDFDGKNIRNKQIAVKRKIGKETNKRYNYGHNVLSIKVEQDYSEIYTAVIGRGKGEDLDDSDGYGRRIEFTDVEWKKPSKPLDKAKGSRTLIDPNATQLFGYHDGNTVSPRTKVEIFSDIEDEAQLLQASYEWLMDNNVPKAVFSLNVPDGDGLDLGDSVHVIYRDIDLIKSTRVTKVIDDLVSGNRSVEFGDTAYFETDRRISGLKAELKRVGGSASSHIARLKAEFDRRFDDEVQQWKDDFEQAVIDAEAAVEVMRVVMTEEFETAQREFEEEFNQSVADAKKHADETAEAKAKQVQENLDSFKGEHEQLVGELQGNIIDIDGEIADARADVSGILGRLTGLDGRASATESSLTVLDDEISSVVGRVSNNESNISSVVQDVRSITSTVATIEGDVATQGSQISQANDVISSKVWLNDVAEIGANLIPQSANAWENGGIWTGSGTESGTASSARMKEAITVQPSTPYTISDNSKYVSAIKYIDVHQYSSTGAHVTFKRISRGEQATFTTGSNTDTIRVALVAIDGFSVVPHFIEHLDGRMKIKLEEGSVATPMVNAISQLQQTADNLTLKVAELSNVDGKEIITQSDISIESDRILIGSQQISSNTLASLISVSPSSIDLITDKMNLTGNLNVKGQIESISTSAVKADFANIFAGTADIQFIVAKHLASDSIQSRHLYVTNAMAEKLVANTVMAREVKSLSIDAVYADLRSVNSEIMTSNIIKSEWLNVDNAIVNRIISRKFFSDNATIKAANIKDLTATDIKGGVLSSLNNSMKFNLITNHLEFNRDATIDFYSKNNMFRMIYPSSIRDNRNVIAGFGTTEASNGSNVAYFGGGHYDIDGTIKANDTGFAGLRVGGGSNDSRLTGTNVEVGGGNASNDMFFRFDFTESGSSRYAQFRPPTSADNYVLGGSSTPFHSIYSWRINRLRFTNLTGHTELRYDNGGTNGAGFRFTETDVYFVRGGLFSIKQAVDRADSAYESINDSTNGLKAQIRKLASRVSALER